MRPDKRALRILFDTYWSSVGWKQAGTVDWVPYTPQDDLAFAMRSGAMFRPRVLGHDAAIKQVMWLRERISPQDVGRGFLASLSTRDTPARSALGSYAVALHMSAHGFMPDSTGRCALCGERDDRGEQDMNILNFERYKWGGVRHDQPTYIVFDLDRFLHEGGRPPSEKDRRTLGELLKIIESQPSGAKLADLAKGLTKIVPGNVAQRRVLISILGFAGVLKIPGRIGYYQSFTPMSERQETPWYKDDWPYPVRWWKGGSGVDKEAISFWFGETLMGPQQ